MKKELCTDSAISGGGFERSLGQAMASSTAGLTLLDADLLPLWQRENLLAKSSEPLYLSQGQQQAESLKVIKRRIDDCLALKRLKTSTVRRSQPPESNSTTTESTIEWYATRNQPMIGRDPKKNQVTQNKRWLRRADRSGMASHS